MARKLSPGCPPHGQNVPVESVEMLASNIKTQAETLQSTLSNLRSQCTREASFTGQAASRYDEFLVEWDSSQSRLMEAINGAGSVISNLATNHRADDHATAAAFD
jgi:uncharacterized protein YukE